MNLSRFDPKLRLWNLYCGRLFDRAAPGASDLEIPAIPTAASCALHSGRYPMPHLCNPSQRLSGGCAAMNSWITAARESSFPSLDA